MLVIVSSLGATFSLHRATFAKQKIWHECEVKGKIKQLFFSLPTFVPSPSGAETFKANLPARGEGGYALHARAHLGD